jgi:hypothetical protein
MNPDIWAVTWVTLKQLSRRYEQARSLLIVTLAWVAYLYVADRATSPESLNKVIGLGWSYLVLTHLTLAAGSISQQRELKTLPLILVRPISSWHYLLGTSAGIAISLGILGTALTGLHMVGRMVLAQGLGLDLMGRALVHIAQALGTLTLAVALSAHVSKFLALFITILLPMAAAFAPAVLQTSSWQGVQWLGRSLFWVTPYKGASGSMVMFYMGRDVPAQTLLDLTFIGIDHLLFALLALSLSAYVLRLRPRRQRPSSQRMK